MSTPTAVCGKALSPSTWRELSSISVPLLLRRNPPSWRRQCRNISAGWKAQKHFMASNSATNCRCSNSSRGLCGNMDCGALLCGRRSNRTILESPSEPGRLDTVAKLGKQARLVVCLIPGKLGSSFGNNFKNFCGKQLITSGANQYVLVTRKT